MTQQIQEIWKKFDVLIETAESPDTKLLIEAIKLQTELLNIRIAPMEHLLGTIATRK
ncbi:hypothetical protein SAMN04515620_1673 [Collimonas sp. OK607]|uniref:hypothetical protein n=1 Tax=Collimonas sp. OK607 TaxID=1798194 RepID=UPI0008DFE9CD|nr:hypothetical protein [Collimonas sp. OK607]SFB40124.1 hypothetical protein SAMN04515620_1673 [Collimonas sp. OK607]